MVKFEHRHPWIVWNGKTTCVQCKVEKNENNRDARCPKKEATWGEEYILKNIEKAIRRRLMRRPAY